jgi:hypothetical protein
MKGFSHRTLAAVLTMGVFASTASAGYKTLYEVTINTVGPKPYATGDLGYVRNSADPIQYIGCEATAILGDCYAVNSAGLYKSCTTTDPAMIQMILTLKGDSSLYFSWNTDGTCKNIRIRNDSLAAPK